jgi:general secretion pathway protein N
MKRTILLIVFGVLVFAGFIVARLPASWALPGPKSGVTCTDVDGTIWNGTCTGLVFQNQAIGDLTWDVHASRLLSGKINVDVTVTRPTGTAHGNVEAGFDKKITARNVQADLPLDQDLVSALPPNFRSLRGKLHTDLTLVRVEGQTIKTIEGLVEAHDLTDGQGNTADHWGSYSLTFPPGASGDPVGQLKDLGGGPLQVEGTLKLTPEPGFDLEGLVKARSTAPPDLEKQIQYLGSPDAQGRRPFSLAATF